MNLRFLSLLAVVILLQQFSFASLHHSAFIHRTFPGFLHFTEKQPQKQSEAFLNLDIEVAEEEDDEVNHSDERSLGSVDSLYAVLKRLYTSSVNCRYIELAQAISGLSDRPLFLLHHSWKTDIS